jgi:hypothetical protein
VLSAQRSRYPTISLCAISAAAVSGNPSKKNRVPIKTKIGDLQRRARNVESASSATAARRRGLRPSTGGRQASGEESSARDLAGFFHRGART